MQKLWKLLAVVLAITLVAASCGDDDGDDTTKLSADHQQRDRYGH